MEAADVAAMSVAVQQKLNRKPSGTSHCRLIGGYLSISPKSAQTAAQSQRLAVTPGAVASW